MPRGAVAGERTLRPGSARPQPARPVAGHPASQASRVIYSSAYGRLSGSPNGRCRSQKLRVLPHRSELDLGSHQAGLLSQGPHADPFGMPHGASGARPATRARSKPPIPCLSCRSSWSAPGRLHRRRENGDRHRAGGCRFRCRGHCCPDSAADDERVMSPGDRRGRPPRRLGTASDRRPRPLRPRPHGAHRRTRHPQPRVPHMVGQPHSDIREPMRSYSPQSPDRGEGS
jgi:hypothetical protein